MQSHRLLLFVFCSSATALLWQSPNKLKVDDQIEDQVEDKVEDLANAEWKTKASKAATSPNKCGVVLGGFGSAKYVETGMKVAKYIRSLNISQGWCPEQDLDKIPVAFFSDKTGLECPEGVECFGKDNMAPWRHGRMEIARPGSTHLGSWKYRWYHAQMLVNSPYELTLYVDVDALPCSGVGIESMFRAFKEGATLGSIKHNHPCGMTMGDCSKYKPKGTAKEDKAEWKHFEERNGGVILADIRKTKHIFQEWALRIEATAGAIDVKGDQLAYRQALFNHRKETKEHLFTDEQVCRALPAKDYNCKQGGCWIYHKPEMQALKDQAIIGKDAQFEDMQQEQEEEE